MNLKEEVERVLSGNRETTFLVRGTAVHNVLTIFGNGRLYPVGKDGMFYFWSSKKGFDYYGVPYQESTPKEGRDAADEAKRWALYHSTEREWSLLNIDYGRVKVHSFRKDLVKEIGEEELSRLERGVQRELRRKKGVVIRFNSGIMELPVQGVGTLPGVIRAGDQFELCYHEGIPIKYIQSIDPIGREDRRILKAHYKEMQNR